jgi:hypothetical protein
MGKMINAYKIPVRRPEGKRPLGKHTHRLDNDIEIDFKETRCEIVEWIQLAQDRV